MTDIDATKAQRWRIGLFEGSGANQLPPEAITRLGANDGGVTYQTLDPSLTVDGASFNPCSDTTLNLDESGIVEWNAWGIAIGEQCSTINAGAGTVETMKLRAIDRLANQTSYLGEYTFWTGLVGGTQFAALAPAVFPNIALTNGFADLTPGDTEAGVVEAFGLVNEYLSDTLRGLRGMIHVAPQILPYLAHYRVTQRTSNTLESTLSDHLVICGSGYQGTGLDNVAVPNNRTFIYGTSMVRVGTSPIDTTIAYDRLNNTAQAIAYRSVLAEWDNVAHCGLRVCLTDPGPTCATAGS